MKRIQAKPAPPPARKRIRCAIYCRKSSEEGLRQEFNSLDAQRNSGEAYVLSQQANGWVCVQTRYDDGGFSGGNLDRPALQRLKADIEAGLIDKVIVYKVDRLSRSLADFIQLAAHFEKHNVSFVAVTQSFDTSTPMGRLMLNVLLSFAQFERDLSGERIRDKIEASRQLGRWTGGTPILGYDVDRSGLSPKLATNPAEASRVLHIFARYVELGALLAVVAELNRLDWRCKAWTTRDGRSRGGQPFDKTRLHALLTNPIYIGKLKHKDAIYTGVHEAIVPAELFERVQRLLKSNGRGGPALRNKHAALLRGLLRCAHCQRAMSHTVTGRGVKRYRYYTCTQAVKRGRAACPGRSLPAAEIEALVVQEIRGIGRDPKLAAATLTELRAQHAALLKRLQSEATTLQRGLARLRSELPQAEPNELGRVTADIEAAEQRQIELQAELTRVQAARIDERQVLAALREFDRVWERISPRERVRLVHLLVQRVEYDAATSSVSITLQPDAAAGLLEPSEVAA